MVPMGMNEKRTLRSIWQDMTMDWLWDRSEGSMTQRT